ncbi:related to serine O-acetyltransferase [Saccharomycodes ludwigii]|uniref:Related to serine O-acetyltransferase n=1 Tax=Saccharomycodes ludwigii TaxID=36035 RepID=A0A376B793_9ASCO|nr:hypothetical protein SCDLUD_004563 [Saccharomycodes ludwigii]KAH3899137.1 hypothetical protein SCDLUD_004563 [Saccharomycodes ludwigii]SSD60449.1 related to serine O-acetyltransferase [Saccharomycodes ludwigii]
MPISNIILRNPTHYKYYTKLSVFNSLSKASRLFAKRNVSTKQMEFPCLDKLEAITKQLKEKQQKQTLKIDKLQQCIDPVYSNIKTGYQIYESKVPLYSDFGGVLPNPWQIAYETWGTLNKERSNAILLHTGLSASSHAHSTKQNPVSGWWENFIGPNNPCLDTNKYFVICTNVLGGCYGSTGPKSIDPTNTSSKDINKRYATRFPMLSIQDIIRAQHQMIKEFFLIDKLYASVGSSMGGMQSLAYGVEFPNELEKIVSVSGCARSHPSSIAMRHAQRQVLMADPHWNRGYYYNEIIPHVGMKLAREIATVTYRSGPEWESRFGNERLDDERQPMLCPDFLIENYLDHQGEKFALEYDANSFLYLSKTMDLFDLSLSFQKRGLRKRTSLVQNNGICSNESCVVEQNQGLEEKPVKRKRSSTVEEARIDLQKGLQPLASKDLLVIGVKTDGLFPYWQQREIVDLVSSDTNYSGKIKHIELDESQSLYGHDTFLLDLENIGKEIGKFLTKN